MSLKKKNYKHRIYYYVFSFIFPFGWINNKI